MFPAMQTSTSPRSNGLTKPGNYIHVIFTTVCAVFPLTCRRQLVARGGSGCRGPVRLRGSRPSPIMIDYDISTRMPSRGRGGAKTSKSLLVRAQEVHTSVLLPAFLRQFQTVRVQFSPSGGEHDAILSNP